MHIRTLKLAALVATAVVASACGNGPELVDRTQPNYIKKADLLQGTWYLQSTVVDVPPTTALTFVGEQNSLEKVRFEVQEDYLVAYRSYEYLPGSEPEVDRSKSTIGHVVTVDGNLYRGAPVAAWKIESHFDRVRDYNPATGEQSNVLVENTQDRPWYDRDYIRVNWGQNAITNWNSATPMPMGGEGRYKPGSSWLQTYVQPIEQDSGDDALVTDYSPNGDLQYFDFTVRQYWSPPSVDYPGYGSIPYCWMNPQEDCRATEVKVRTSIRRVDEAHVADYEPLVYGDRLMKKFGFFRLGMSEDRPTYDKDQGATLSGRLLYAMRHDIWQRAHDDQGNVIPVEQRQVKPVVYYLSDSWPKDLMESARGMESSWDHAFRRSVAVPRGIQPSDVPQMFYVCENPVPAGAPAACGPEGTHVRRGDLRYNMVNWVDQPQLAGPLGFGPSAADPETGEIVHAVANIYGAGIDNLTGTTLQMLDVLNGDISMDTLLSGKDVRDFFQTNRAPTDPRAAGPAVSRSGLTNDATQKGAVFARLQGDLLAKVNAMKASGSLPLEKQDRRAVVEQLIEQHPALEGLMIDDPEIRAAVMAAAPSPEMRAKLSSDQEFYRQVAQETMNHLSDLEAMEKTREDLASKKGLWLAEFSDDAYIWLARDTKNFYQTQLTQYQASGKSAEEAKKLAKYDAWNRIRNGLNRFITAHEVGHTLGLMHNFIATFDAMNFQDGYWDLRKSSIGVLADGKRVMPLSPQDLLDASQPTQEQLEKGMPTLEYSSVMDYTARFPNHPHGVGKYDEAAILFGYSGGAEPGWVEVFAQTRADTDKDAWTAPNDKIDTTNLAKPLLVRGAHAEIPLAQVEHWTPASTFYSDKFHYTTLPFHFADKNLPFDQALDQGIERMKNRTFVKWSEMQKIYDLIELNLTNYYLDGTSFGGSDSTRAQTVIGETVQMLPSHRIPVEVPFMYCSDIEVGANLGCNRWDAGADYFEMTRDWMQRYQDYYAFSNFRRDRAFFDPIRNVLSSKFSRYTGNLPNVYQHWLYSIYWYRYGYHLNANEMEEFLGVGDPITQAYWTMAVVDSTNLLMGELVQPSAGYFGKEVSTGHWVHLQQNNTTNTRFNPADEQALKDSVTSGPGALYSEIVYVPRGPGKNMYTLFADDGYQSYTRVNEAGHFWDQYGALMALSSSETNFLGVDRGSDALRYSLPYYMTFPKEMNSVFSSIWLEDNGRYASSLVKNGDGTARIQKPVFIHGEDYVSDFIYPPKAVVPVNDPAQVPEPVNPTQSWSGRFYSELFGMAYFSSNFDLGYAYQNQVFRLGSGEAITPASGYEVVTFDDPFGGGYTYAALEKTGATSPSTSASWMIAQAKELKSDWDYKQQQADAATDPQEKARWEALASEYEGKTREAVRKLEMMRALYDIFGRAW